MLRRTFARAGLAVGLLAGIVAFGGNAVASPLYVYKGNGSDGRKALPAFEKYIGRKVDGVVDFVAFDSWSSFDSDGSWGIGGWKGSGYKLAESVPLTVKGTSLADVAAGKQDSHFTKLAQTLVSNGFADAYIRLGWEFNGGWYPWAFAGHEKDYSAAFRHVVQVMRAAAGSKFRFVWNPALFEQQQWPDAAYPGDDVVDVVATDAYDQSWTSGYTDPSRRWNSILNDSWGIQNVVTFAQKHSKPFAFPEWGAGTRPDGHGGGDDALFINNMYPFVNKAEFSGYWDYAASDFNGLVSTGNYPKAGQALVANLSGTASSSTSPAAPSPAPATPSPSAPAQAAPGATAISASVTDGGTAQAASRSDGSAVLTLNFPKTTQSHHYTIFLSAARQVGSYDPKTGKGSTAWGRLKQLGWDTSGGTAYVYVSNS